MRFFAVVLMAVSALVGSPVSLAAQSTNPPKLSQLVHDLYFQAIVDEILTFVDVFGDVVDPAELVSAGIETGVQRLQFIDHVIGLAGNQLSSFPLGSASGGFTWTFDTSSAAMTRGSNSFGPIFAERPLTVGRRRLNVGTNYQRVTFDRLDGKRLRGGEIVGYFGRMFDRIQRPPVGIFFADSLDVRVTTDTLNAFATFGLTDRFDIGVAVPFSRVDLRATLSSRVGTTEIGVPDDQEAYVRSTSGTASGLGDMVIRAKYNIVKRERVALAESVDVRLPTGDELDLLGVAGPQIKLTFIASTDVGKLSPHFNFAYTITGTSTSADDQDAIIVAPPEEINYAGGADLALSLRSTVAFDVVGRILRQAGTLTWAPSQFGAQYQQFHANPGQDLYLLLGSLGFKVNPFRNMLLTTNVLFPLTKSGLTDNLTWMAGFDYSF
jgi:hypothetical protein